VTVKSKKARRRSRRRGHPRRHHGRGAAKLPAIAGPTPTTPPACAGSERRRRRGRLAAEGSESAKNGNVLARSFPTARSPTISPTSHARPKGRDRSARQGGKEARGCRPLGDQRGLCVGGHQFGTDARHRRRERHVNGGAIALGHPIGAPARASSALLCTSFAAAAAGSAVRPSVRAGGQGDRS